MARALEVYRRKRDFRESPEPRGRKRKGASQELVYVVHKHAARRLHYDVRLELDGVLMSFAVPKGPPLEPGERRLAVRTEDHPLEYVSFEGVIPAGQYGAGTMEIWDSGIWEPEGDAHAGLEQGKLAFRLAGRRCRGRWTLVKLSEARSRDGRDWLMIKRSDRAAAVLAAPAARPKKGALRPGSLPGARRAAQPRALAPELCRLAARAPEGEGWLHEIKFDGYRLIAILARGRARLLTRRGEDWSARFPRVAEALSKLRGPAVIDGEVVVLDGRGASDFQRLQNALRDGGADPLLYAFDLPWCGGYDLAQCPLQERKRLLAQLVAELPAEGRVRFSEHVVGDGPAFLEHACKLGLEGAISKPAAAPYTAAKRVAWIKTKCLQRQEFVVAGWSEPTGSRRHLGALLLGYHDDQGELRAAGKVGTGFTQTSLRELAQRLAPLARESSPFARAPRGAAARGVHWVEPRCVVEVAFTGWTSDGRLRHPSFQGVREDKRARDVVRERERALPALAKTSSRKPAAKKASASAKGARVAGVTITHPERVLYPELGVTKLELAEYYAAVAEHILPHVADRPLTLVRCPEGRAQGCFYQKHRTDDLPESIQGIRVPEKGKTAVYVGVRDAAGLVALVQRGVLELHPWGARADHLERPDRLVIDLDPGPDVPWPRVIAAARELRELARELGLASFARTTGGKGLHVVLPIERRSTWAEAKGFAHALGRALARRDPDAFVLVASKARRKGRIFVDYLRNAQGATAVASWSTRSFPGATVAVPLAWDEVDRRLAPSKLDVRTALKRLDDDAWKGFFDVRQALTRRVLEGVEKL